MSLRQAGQVLMIDADDTLWENNIYFERSIAGFISFLDHRVHTPAEVREHLNRMEQETIAEQGYGLMSFRRSLLRCFETLHGAPADQSQREAVAGFADLIGNHEIELLPGVCETLAVLGGRHRLLLVTKGDPLEQRGKLEASGLASCFEAVEVLAEKHEAAYREIVARYALDPATTWMIGNSPKSDINPALAAGLNAVLVPHEHTWVLEHEAVEQARAGRTLLQVQTFSDLLKYL